MIGFGLLFIFLFLLINLSSSCVFVSFFLCRDLVLNHWMARSHGFNIAHKEAENSNKSSSSVQNDMKKVLKHGDSKDEKWATRRNYVSALFLFLDMVFWKWTIFKVRIFTRENPLKKKNSNDEYKTECQMRVQLLPSSFF